MDFLYSVFFGAGATAIFYSTLGRRVGYTNSKNIATVMLVVFVIATIVFFSLFALFLK